MTHEWLYMPCVFTLLLVCVCVCVRTRVLVTCGHLCVDVSAQTHVCVWSKAHTYLLTEQPGGSGLNIRDACLPLPVRAEGLVGWWAPVLRPGLDRRPWIPPGGLTWAGSHPGDQRGLVV